MSTFRQKVQAKTDWGKPDPEEEAQVSAKRTITWPGKSKGSDTDRPAGKPARKARRTAQPPVTAHRLFPAFAALWFAALFGLGSLAISSEVLGRIVTAIGLPALVPAAAPPLGFTAHLLVALVLTMVGAALGLLIGLRLRPHAAEAASAVEAPPSVAVADGADVPKVRARDAHPDAPPRRPLVLAEAFGDPVSAQVDSLPAQDFVTPEGPLLRRKPAQLEADAAPSEPDIFIPVFAPGGVAADEPLDLASLDLLEPHDADGEATPFSAPAPLVAMEPEAEPVAQVLAEPQPEQAAETVTPLEAAPAPIPTLIAATPQIPSGFTLPGPSADQIEAGEPWSPVAGAPLADLGLVQLIERLALAIAAQKAARDAGPPPPSDGVAPDPVALADEPEPEPEIEVVPLVVTPPDAPFAKPADPAPSSGEEPAGSARDAIMRRLGAVVPPVSAPAQDGPPPFSRPAQVDAVVPLHVPPMPAAPIVTPAPVAAPASLESEEALRSALATLQRMSARG